MASTLDRHPEAITINRFGREPPVFRHAPPCLPALFARPGAEKIDKRAFKARYSEQRESVIART